MQIAYNTNIRLVCFLHASKGSELFYAMQIQF